MIPAPIFENGDTLPRCDVECERDQPVVQPAWELVNHRSQTRTSILRELPSATRSRDRLAIKCGRRIMILKMADIDWIESGYNCVKVHEDKRAHLMRGTMGGIERKLPPETFVRISRSVIVNVDRVKELQPTLYGEYQVTLQDGTNLTLSRRYRKKLPQLGVG